MERVFGPSDVVFNISIYFNPEAIGFYSQGTDFANPQMEELETFSHEVSVHLADLLNFVDEVLEGNIEFGELSKNYQNNFLDGEKSGYNQHVQHWKDSGNEIYDNIQCELQDILRNDPKFTEKDIEDFNSRANQSISNHRIIYPEK